jgi:hypothetical protein
MADCRDLQVGDHLYEICSHGRGKNKRVYAVLQKVTSVHERFEGVRGGIFKTTSCYADGEPMIYFGMWFRRTSGVEVGNWQFEQPTDRPRIRLVRELPQGIELAQRPEPQRIAA